MISFLYGIDIAVFRFMNLTLSCTAGDFFWPIITDYDKILAVRVVLIAAWLVLMIKGGVRGRTAALMVIVMLFCSDQLSSTVIKSFVQRPRPCQIVNGVRIVPDVHLLAGCGGTSFPSSHAVNNFAVATLFAWYYRRWRYAFYGWAALIAASRVFVGVHYPSDCLGGAVIGTLLGLAVIGLWSAVARRWFPSLAVVPTSPGAR